MDGRLAIMSLILLVPLELSPATNGLVIPFSEESKHMVLMVVKGYHVVEAAGRAVTG